MNKYKNIATNLAFSLNILLAFVWYFEDKLQLPTCLQVVGRAHPMLLHLPIGLLVVMGLLWLVRKHIARPSFLNIMLLLLATNAFFAAMTAVMGFFLSRESGYDAELLLQHKYGGIGLSFFSYVLLLIFGVIAQRELSVGLRHWAQIALAKNAGREAAVRSTELKASAKGSDHERSEWARPNIIEKSFGILLLLGLVGVVFTGHSGATMTHGEGFLTAPLALAAPADTVMLASGKIFADAVMPIFKEKCVSCHNATKSKGELQLHTIEAVLKGGKSGALWDTLTPANSLILKRLHLDIEDEKHMPPKGKPQLTSTEIDLIAQWITHGAKIDLSLTDLANSDTLFKIATDLLSSRIKVVGKTYLFPAASAATIRELNTPFRKVEALSAGSPALKASFFVRSKYAPDALTDLTKIKEQLVYLNLSNMPIEDAEAAVIAQFGNVVTLHLNNSNVGNAGVAQLVKLTNLTHLSLVGTKIDSACIVSLAAMRGLKYVFLWNTRFSVADMARLSAIAPNLRINDGYQMDEKEVLALTMPVFANKKATLTPDDSVILKHNMPGVEIRYTTDDTEPDSLTSEVYTRAFCIQKSTKVKAKAFRIGWGSSEVAQINYFISGYKPEVVELKTPTSPKYQGQGDVSLIDGEKGDPTNFNLKKWLGYDSTSFDAVFHFTKLQPNVSKITISYCRNVPSYIVPPRRVELLAGNDLTNLKSVKILNFPPITKKELSDIFMDALEINIPNSRYKYYRIKVENEKKLPIIHPGKGARGWFFVDEIYFN